MSNLNNLETVLNSRQSWVSKLVLDMAGKIFEENIYLVLYRQLGEGGNVAVLRLHEGVDDTSSLYSPALEVKGEREGGEGLL